MKDYIYSIFTWSQLQLAEKCAASLLSGEEYEIVNVKQLKFPSLAAAWNDSIQRNLRDYEAVILMNDDVECVDPRPTGKALLGVLKKYGEMLNAIVTVGYDINLHGNKGLCAMPSYEVLPGAFCICITQKFVDEIGLFDEQFERAWWEDTDMWRRVYLKGYNAASIAPVNHYGGGTTVFDPDAAYAREKYFVKNMKRYISKWGGSTGEEQFIVPYNDEFPKAIVITTKCEGCGKNYTKKQMDPYCNDCWKNRVVEVGDPEHGQSYWYRYLEMRDGKRVFEKVTK